MLHRVVHITDYRYNDSVPLCHNVLHLQPRDTSRQEVVDFVLTIAPDPESRRDRLDYFGNNVSWLSLQEPHQRLRIEARSEVEVSPFEPPELFRWPDWETAAQEIRNRHDLTSLDARQFTFDSPFVPRGPELAAYGQPSFKPGRSLWDAAVDLNERINKDFKFDSGVTTIGTPVTEVLQFRHGVCQDFAHVMIGCMRSFGLAARYVSGYLVTKPPEGMPRLVGADVSHAWVSIFFPDFGWIDFDPTNACIPSFEHITVGWGRDYEDISPVKGVIVGGKRHTLTVSVDVEPISSHAAVVTAENGE